MMIVGEVAFKDGWVCYGWTGLVNVRKLFGFRDARRDLEMLRGIWRYFERILEF